jgi:uncharacterized protein YecT (DUF1311 family)
MVLFRSRRKFPGFVCVSVICFAVSGANLQSADPDASPIPDSVERKVDELREEAKSTDEMVQAEARGMELWDTELNRVYRLLQTKLPEPDRRKLINSQRAWLSFRDANREIIQAVYERAQGSMYRPIAVNAELQIVKERAENLRGYLATIEEAWPDER